MQATKHQVNLWVDLHQRVHRLDENSKPLRILIIGNVSNDNRIAGNAEFFAHRRHRWPGIRNVQASRNSPNTLLEMTAFEVSMTLISAYGYHMTAHHIAESRYVLPTFPVMCSDHQS